MITLLKHTFVDILEQNLTTIVQNIQAMTLLTDEVI